MGLVVRTSVFLMFFLYLYTFCLFVHLTIWLSVRPSACLSVCFGVHASDQVWAGHLFFRAGDVSWIKIFILTVGLFICLSVGLSVCPSAYLSVCFGVHASDQMWADHLFFRAGDVRWIKIFILSVCLFICLSVRLSVCPSANLSVCFGVHASD